MGSGLTPDQQLALFTRMHAPGATAAASTPSAPGTGPASTPAARGGAGTPDEEVRSACLAYLRRGTLQYRYAGPGVHQCSPERCDPINVDRLARRLRDFQNPLVAAPRSGRGGRGVAAGDPQWHLCKYGTVHYCNGKTQRSTAAEYALCGPPCIMGEYGSKEQRCRLTMRSHGFPANGLDPRVWGDAEATSGNTREDSRHVSGAYNSRRRQHRQTRQRLADPHRPDAEFSGLLSVDALPASGAPHRTPPASTSSRIHGEQAAPGQGQGQEQEQEQEHRGRKRPRHQWVRLTRGPDGQVVEQPASGATMANAASAASVHQRLSRKRQRHAEHTIENDMQIAEVSNEVVDLFFYSPQRAERLALLKRQMAQEMKKGKTAVTRAFLKKWKAKLREVRTLPERNRAFRQFVARLVAVHYRFLLQTPSGARKAHVFDLRRLCFTLLVCMYSGGLLHGSRYLIPPCVYVRQNLPGPSHYEAFGFRNKVANEMVKHIRAAVEGMEQHEIPFDRMEVPFAGDLALTRPSTARAPSVQDAA